MLKCIYIDEGVHTCHFLRIRIRVKIRSSEYDWVGSSYKK